MFITKNRIGSVVAVAFAAVTLLSAVDAEAARCHRNRRPCCYDPCVTVCCEPCAATCCEPCGSTCAAPCATTWCDPCRGTIVVERAVVSGCCVAAIAPAPVVIAATSEPATTATLARR